MARAVPITLSIVAIVVCGTVGGVAAWAIVTSIGLTGIAASLVAAVVGMVIALAAWTAVITLLHRIARRRSIR